MENHTVVFGPGYELGVRRIQVRSFVWRKGYRVGVNGELLRNNCALNFAVISQLTYKECYNLKICIFHFNTVCSLLQNT